MQFVISKLGESRNGDDCAAPADCGCGAAADKVSFFQNQIPIDNASAPFPLFSNDVFLPPWARSSGPSIVSSLLVGTKKEVEKLFPNLFEFFGVAYVMQHEHS